MKNILILIFSLLIFGCSNKEKVVSLSPIEFYNQISKDWIYGSKISDFKFNGVIDRPVGVELFLFQVNFLDVSSKKILSQCVYYKVPFKKVIGELIVTNNRELFDCSETPSSDVLFITSDVNKLEISFVGFNLNMKFVSQNKPYQFVIPFANIRGPSLHAKNKFEVESKFRNGMTFLRVDREARFLPSNNYLGNKEDRFSAGTAIQCLKLDKSCNQVGEDFCDKCRFGTFEVVDYNCPQGGSRFCGVNHCGEKNEPACIRGLKTLDNEFDGICSGDLRPVLNGDHILICQ